VTIKADNDVVFTHRVIGITTSGDELSFQTQGDANETPDVALAPSRAIVGRVASFVPTLGYLLVILSTPKGMLTALALGAFLFLFGRLADETRRGTSGRKPGVAPGAELTPPPATLGLNR
jgi:signal peptidase